MANFTLEHLGIAISNPESALDLFRRLLDAEPYKVETIEREGVRTYFIGDGGVPGASPKIELLEVLSEASPVAKFIEKRGPGLHHLAFEVEDIEAQMKRLESEGFDILWEAPKPGADNKRVVFLHPKTTGGILVELCESIKPRPEQIQFPYGDATLTAFVSGPADAPPLVVLHGALNSTEFEMRRLTRLWDKDFRVCALDFMGHGASDAYEGRGFSLEGFSENAIALLDALEIPRAHLFGFSLGGSVALLAAHLHAERFDRLVIHAHNVQWNDEERDRMVRAMESALVDPDSSWSQRLAQMHGEDRWRDLTLRMVAFTEALPGRHFLSADLATIQHATLVSSGDSDQLFGLRHSLMLHETLTHSNLAILPGVDHPIQTINPTSFAALVKDHLLSK